VVCAGRVMGRQRVVAARMSRLRRMNLYSTPYAKSYSDLRTP
jgi:hypothetical protein